MIRTLKHKTLSQKNKFKLFNNNQSKVPTRKTESTHQHEHHKHNPFKQRMKSPNKDKLKLRADQEINKKVQAEILKDNLERDEEKLIKRNIRNSSKNYKICNIKATDNNNQVLEQVLIILIKYR